MSDDDEIIPGRWYDEDNYTDLEDMLDDWWNSLSYEEKLYDDLRAAEGDLERSIPGNLNSRL